MKIEINIDSNELKEYLFEGFYPKELINRNLEVSDVQTGQYKNDFVLVVSGDEEDLRDFMEFYFEDSNALEIIQ